MKDRLKWCCNQKHGIELIEPNKNLADAFILKAEHFLEEMKNAKYKESKISFAYYTMYNGVYALLQRMGIKSEIHVCTFECIRAFFPLSFTFATNEPAQCKIDYNLTTNFELMNFYVNGSSLFVLLCVCSLAAAKPIPRSHAVFSQAGPYWVRLRLTSHAPHARYRNTITPNTSST